MVTHSKLENWLCYASLNIGICPLIENSTRDQNWVLENLNITVFGWMLHCPQAIFVFFFFGEIPLIVVQLRDCICLCICVFELHDFRFISATFHKLIQFCVAKMCIMKIKSSLNRSFHQFNLTTILYLRSLTIMAGN